MPSLTGTAVRHLVEVLSSAALAFVVVTVVAALAGARCPRNVGWYISAAVLLAGGLVLAGVAVRSRRWRLTLSPAALVTISYGAFLVALSVRSPGCD